MATASPTGGRRAIHPVGPGTLRRAVPRRPVGHHRGVPIEPFSEFDPYGGRARARAPGRATCWWPRRRRRPQLLPRRVILVLDHGAPRRPRRGDRPARRGGRRPAAAAVARRWPRRRPSCSPVARWPATRSSAWSGWPSRDAAADGRARAVRPGWRLLVDDDRPVGTVDLDADPATVAGSIVGARLFSGYAGWETGQLEDEIEEGSWYVVPAEARDPISADPEGLWRRVLRRQGGALALVSGFPSGPDAQLSLPRNGPSVGSAGVSAVEAGPQGPGRGGPRDGPRAGPRSSRSRSMSARVGADGRPRLRWATPTRRRGSPVTGTGRNRSRSKPGMAVAGRMAGP